MEKIPSKTKVLFVITKSNFGGAQKYVYDLAVGLPRGQFETTVALGGKGVLANKLHEAHIRTLSLPSLARDVNPLKDITSFVALFQLFRSERPDVVHLNSAKASGLGALAARLAGIPRVIFTAHGWAFNEDRSVISRIVIKILSYATVLLVHKTIAVSEAVRQDTRNWLFIRNKIITIHNGVDSTEFLPREEARSLLFARTESKIFKDALIVGTIAELHKNKGLPYAIETIAMLTQKNSSLFYFILGNGEERKRLVYLLKHHKLQERVFLLGFVENAANYLKAFDIFILPSIKEGLPYVLLEAGLASLPIVASHIGGIPEIIEDGKTGFLVPSRDPRAISAALQRLIESPSLRNTLGSTLHKKILRDFSLNAMVSRTAELYEKN